VSETGERSGVVRVDIESALEFLQCEVLLARRLMDVS